MADDIHRDNASMTGNAAADRTDPWAEWLLNLRHAGDPNFARAIRQDVRKYADRVLDGAQLAAGMTLVDVGSGEGLVAFAALERMGSSLQVVMTDVSATLLRHAENLAIARQVHGQCSFVRCDAQKLQGVADVSADVVATRSVLAYVADKCAALREFYRVLKPGGRISLAEPIFQDEAFAALALRARLDAQPADRQDRFLRLLHRWKSLQFPDTPEKIARSPIANFSERNLLNFVQLSGFTRVHLELHIDVELAQMPSWEVFLGSSPHPWALPLKTILAEHFDAEERAMFESLLRPTVESGSAWGVSRMVYLQAVKPVSGAQGPASPLSDA